MVKFAKTSVVLPLLLVVALLALIGCKPTEPVQMLTRAEAVPETAVKMTPEMDVYPPVLHSDGWENPVPLGSPIDTAGGEDSPFITPDGNNFYFFFTPDVSVPAEKQLLDGSLASGGRRNSVETGLSLNGLF
jgi:hypothetical protein